MGLVDETQQFEPFRRMVVLKVIGHGMDTGEVLARFDRERKELTVRLSAKVGNGAEGAPAQGHGRGRWLEGRDNLADVLPA